jgi:hypothetical protein
MSDLRLDGMMNVMRSMSQYGARAASYSTGLGAELYATSGLAASIVDRPAEDAMSRGIEIEGDTQGLLADEYDRLRVVHHATEALRTALLRGGAAILPLTDDAATLAEPLNPGRIKAVRALQVIAATELTPVSGDRYVRDTTSPFYGEPEAYTWRIRGGRAPDREVHYTRLLRVPGEPMPADVAEANGLPQIPWVGRPVLDGCMGALEQYRSALWWVMKTLERKQSPQISMAGLAEALAEGASGEKLVQDRLALLDLQRSTINTTAVDAADTFGVTDLSVGGLDAVVGKYEVQLCADARMPHAILFQDQPKGLGASGMGEMQNWHARLENLRSHGLRAALESLTELISLQRGIGRGQWRITFPPLWSPSAKEKAEADKIDAEAQGARVTTMAALMTAGVMLPEEGRAYVADKLPDFGLTPGLPAELEDFEPAPVEEPPADGPPAPL